MAGRACQVCGLVPPTRGTGFFRRPDHRVPADLRGSVMWHCDGCTAAAHARARRVAPNAPLARVELPGSEETAS